MTVTPWVTIASGQHRAHNRVAYTLVLEPNRIAGRQLINGTSCLNLVDDHTIGDTGVSHLYDVRHAQGSRCASSRYFLLAFIFGVSDEAAGKGAHTGTNEGARAGVTCSVPDYRARPRTDHAAVSDSCLRI